jgi:hypothetical protein
MLGGTIYHIEEDARTCSFGRRLALLTLMPPIMLGPEVAHVTGDGSGAEGRRAVAGTAPAGETKGMRPKSQNDRSQLECLQSAPLTVLVDQCRGNVSHPRFDGAVVTCFRSGQG